MNSRHRRLEIIIMNAVFFFSLSSIFPSVHAHKPLASDNNNNVLEGATKIPDHKISWAIYQELEGTEEVEYYYRFSARQGEIGFLHAGKTILDIEKFQSFSPAVVLIGKNLDKAKLDAQNSQVRLAHSRDTVYNHLNMHGNTGLVLEYDNNNSVLPKLFYEPFTQTSYLIRQELAIPSLSSTGEYAVAIYDGGLQSDGLREYVLAIGEREDFGPIDFFTTLPAAWFETKLYFQDYLSMAVAIAVIASAIIIIILISTIIFRKRITARLQARAKLSRRHGIH
jgi:hypothetical protein